MATMLLGTEVIWGMSDNAGAGNAGAANGIASRRIATAFVAAAMSLAAPAPGPTLAQAPGGVGPV